MSTAFSSLARAVFDALPDALLVFDPDGRLVYSNQAGRDLVEDLDGLRDADSADQLLPALGRRGARVEALWSGGLRMGQAVFVPHTEEAARETLADRERRAILETLNATGWKLTESARRLGISRTTLWRRLNAYGLERPT